MPIIRSSYQSDESLEEFYDSREWKEATKLISNNMLKLIGLINKNFKETRLVASTSLGKECQLP